MSRTRKPDPGGSAKRRFLLLLVPLLAVVGGAFPRAQAAGARAAPGPALWIERPVVRVELRGLRHTRPAVVRRELSSIEGDPIDWGRLERDRLRLLDLGLFAELALHAYRDSLTDQPVLVVHARERPTLLAYPVLEYDPEDGWIYGAYASSLNLRGMNQQMGASWYQGGRRGASLSLYTPWMAGRRLGLGLGGSVRHSRNRTEDLVEDARGIALSLSPTLGAQTGFPFQIGVEEVRSRPRSDGGPAPALRDAGPDSTDHRWLQVGVWRDTRDYRARPRQGGLRAFSFAANGGLLGGDTRFERYRVDLLQVLSTGGWTAFTAASRLVWSRGSVPRYLRLSLGGVETLRGYGQGVYGGESRWNAWVEERFPLLPTRTFSILRGRYAVDLTLDGAVFLDGGAIWEGRALENGRARARWGGGAGLRLVAPWFRLISFDLATDGHGLRVYGRGGMRL